MRWNEAAKNVKRESERRRDEAGLFNLEKKREEMVHLSFSADVMEGRGRERVRDHH